MPTWARALRNDRALLSLVTSASICCGSHAGSPDVMRRTVRLASDQGVVVGAHPGYADRDGFGRRDQNLTSLEVAQLVESQLNALIELANESRIKVAFVKPHGALYNQAQRSKKWPRPS